MGLNTGNAGSTIAGSQDRNTETKSVEILIGTFVASVGRDVQAGEIVSVNDTDYRFLVPYNFARLVAVKAEAKTDRVETFLASIVKGKGRK